MTTTSSANTARRRGLRQGTLARQRIRLSLTQADLAKLCGCTLDMVRSAERGSYTMETLHILEEGLNRRQADLETRFLRARDALNTLRATNADAQVLYDELVSIAYEIDTADVRARLRRLVREG